MADVTINIELVSGLGLPYEPGAETALGSADALAFASVSGVAGTPLTLVPGFDLPIEELADLLSAARQGGVEPPDLFAWYALSCPDTMADVVVSALQALPFVLQASVQSPKVVAGWDVVTDPDTVFQRYLRMAPAGINAFAAWQVPGGSGRGARVADVELGWDLHHPDLESAAVTVLQPFSAPDDHGTSCLGIVGARASGAVTTGIAPRADLAVSPGAANPAAAIGRAARHVGRGGIVLIELAEPLNPNVPSPDAPLEHDPMVKAAILAATALGVLVVEPAGNKSINLDTDPRFVHLRPPPVGIDSGALLVAASDCDNDAEGFPTNEWMPASFTTGGARVNCFAPGAGVTAPVSSPQGLTTNFGGTSAASAIVAGIAAVVQGVAMASDRGRPLPSSELHARLADPQFGEGPRAVSPTNPQLIGVMPDLEKLIEGLGVPRIPQTTALRAGDGTVALMRSRRGEINQLDILEWAELAGTWRWSTTTGTVSRLATVSGHPVALHGTSHGGVTRIDAVTPSERGGLCHRPFILDVGLGLDQPWQAITLPTSELDGFEISAPMTIVASQDRMLVSGLATEGASLVVIAERKAGSRDVVPTTSVSDVVTGHEPVFVRPGPLVRFLCPPVIFDHAGSVVLVGVDHDGWIRFAQWSLELGWTPFESVERGLDPAEPPALTSDGSALHVIGFDSASGELREAVRSPDAGTLFQWSALRAIAMPPIVTWGTPLDPVGGISAASDGAGTLMAMALNASGLPIATVRLPGLDWSPVFFVPTLTTFVARGGLALASSSPGVFVAVASDARGAAHSARWTVIGWTPFVPA